MNYLISPQDVSEYTSGGIDVNREIFSAENNYLSVLHDSRGYGAGELKNFQKLKEFINIELVVPTWGVKRSSRLFVEKSVIFQLGSPALYPISISWDYKLGVPFTS